MDTRIALGVNNAPINALGSFAQGEAQAQGVEAGHMQHAKDIIETVGAGAMHALNGDINGEVDPVKYGEVMDSFEQMGVDVSKFRDNPEFAKVAAHASVGALNEISQANNERDYKLVIDKWQKDLEQQGIENARADRSLDILAQNADTRAAAASATSPTGDIPQQVGDAIISGQQPPSTSGLYKYGAPVRAYLASKGYDLAAAQLEFDATKRHLAAMNSTQQNRLGQAIDTLDGSLDEVQSLADQWAAGNFPTLNAAARKAALEGALGPEANSIITQLDAQIKDVTAELANVYMGGNSPTEQALKLAEHSLNSDWSDTTLSDMIALAKTNIAYRRNAIANAETAGLGHNRYEPGGNGGGDAGDDGDVMIEEVP